MQQTNQIKCKSPTQLILPIQLLVEGNDQRNFFGALIKQLSLSNIQIQNFGGVDELRGFLQAFVNMPNFSTVKSLGIVRDAEKNATNAFQSVQSSLRNAKLAVPDHPKKRTERTNSEPAVTVLILPDEDHPGMLETLLCETFTATAVEQCIDGFFDCMDGLPDMSVNRSAKARARAYILTKPEPHVSVGVAAQKNYWDLKHDAFSHLRNFLQQL